MTVPMKKVAIPNIDIMFWNQKNNLPQGNYLISLTQHEITRHIPFKLMDIKYD